MLTEVLSNIASIAEAFALLFALFVAWFSVKQTLDLHNDTQRIETQAFDASRMDAVFTAAGALLETTAEYKTVLIPYSHETEESLAHKTSTHDEQLLERQMAVHRALETFFAKNRILEIALVALPDPTVNHFTDAEVLKSAQDELLVEARWLSGAAMMCYFTLLNPQNDKGRTQVDIDNDVFARLVRQVGDPPADYEQRYATFLASVRKEWTANRTSKVLEDQSPAWQYSPQVADLLLQGSERRIAHKATVLAEVYRQVRDQSLKRISERRKRWLLVSRKFNDA